VLLSQASLRRQSEKLDLIDKNNIKLEKEIQLIKTNPFYEEREIRRVLGYVKKDEIIFEFKGSGQNSSD
jgi:cell division protein FtsB